MESCAALTHGLKSNEVIPGQELIFAKALTPEHPVRRMVESVTPKTLTVPKPEHPVMFTVAAFTASVSSAVTPWASNDASGLTDAANDARLVSEVTSKSPSRSVASIEIAVVAGSAYTLCPS